ncbi:MAG: peptidase [Bacteroidota bacterium]
MTYCLGIRVKDGLVALADTRITSGSETTTAKKISIHQQGNNKLFLMTSGLRSIRDKAVTYFEEILESDNLDFDKMYKVVNAFGEQLRKVAAEDKAALAESGLFFNLFTIVGGQLENDDQHKLYMLYPEGNWIEIGEATPFTIIGNSGYGKPILNRALTYESSIPFALKTGFLSFDSTRVSANDVGYPIDVVIYRAGQSKLIERRFHEEQTGHIGEMWGEKLKRLIHEVPDVWDQVLMDEDKPSLLQQSQQQQQ